MTKSSKFKNNHSPVCVPDFALNPSPKLKEKINTLELKYKFKENGLLQSLNELINWFHLEKELERQALRPADEKKVFKKLMDDTNNLLLTLGNSGGQVRNKIIDIIQTKEFLNQKSADEKRNAVPHLIEDALEILSEICFYAIAHIRTDPGGNTPHSSKPKNIIFKLIKIYSENTGEKPSCYNDIYTETGFKGDFYNFLVELNPLLLEIDQEMDLGTPVTIGGYAKECIAKEKGFSIKA